jgi:hypothetical protein
MAVSGNTRLRSALEANWQAEMEGVHTYAALSEREEDSEVPNRIVNWVVLTNQRHI